MRNLQTLEAWQTLLQLPFAKTTTFLPPVNNRRQDADCEVTGTRGEIEITSIPCSQDGNWLQYRPLDYPTVVPV
eukprot:1150263-Pelagomonas_calceolata.AAC.6